MPERKFVLYFSAIGKRKFSPANTTICRTKKGATEPSRPRKLKLPAKPIHDPAAPFISGRTGSVARSGGAEVDRLRTLAHAVRLDVEG
ncbi:hypothetical protein, partial [Mesorhizobium sp. M1A.F.Ca.IN.020.06.1.1]|uniref:hypothetical protein n=1 Tax=Mesorhizobium sp. M1A.F.Ca.IN.020.06.1.1 TaxID=2496765 RepID=UPI0019D457A2